MKIQVTEETTLQAVRTLFANLATIRCLKPEDLLLPGRKTTYEKTLEETYAVIGVNPWGQTTGQVKSPRKPCIL